MFILIKIEILFLIPNSLVIPPFWSVSIKLAIANILKQENHMKFETKAVHAGYKPDPVTKAVEPPIYQTVAYAFDSAQHGADLFDLKVPGNIYTRIMNPTQSVLEERVTALEGGIAALALA